MELGPSPVPRPLSFVLNAGKRTMDHGSEDGPLRGTKNEEMYHMDSNSALAERRYGKRSLAEADHGIVAVRVRPGHQAIVVNVSVHGVLIETAHRLLPGAPVEMHLQTSEHRVTMPGRVLRCWVCALGASRIQYRGAVRFDRELSWFLPVRTHEYLVLTHSALARAHATRPDLSARNTHDSSTRKH